MAARDEIIHFLEETLTHSLFDDHHLNGLQVEGTPHVSRIGAAVDGGNSVIHRAAELGVDLLIVHHGIFWDRPLPIAGPLLRSIHMLVSRGMNLYAAHLPLDAHPEWGNNFGLARQLELTEIVPAVPHRGRPIGCIGRNDRKMEISEIAAQLAALPGALQPIFTLTFGPKVPERICVVTGAGADALQRAKVDGFDTLITGEPRQFAYHYAKEQQLNLICAGHYATETVGVQALALQISTRWGVPWDFIDEPTGI